jgi:hypothetical protein
MGGDESDVCSYFSKYEGFAQCDIKATDLYQPPTFDLEGSYSHGGYCSRRADLLESMSNGGRIGFDAPYTAASMFLQFWKRFETNLCRLPLPLVHHRRDLHDP